MREARERLAIATVLRPHGVKGAVRVACSRDHVGFLRDLPVVCLRSPEGEVREVQVVAVGGTDELLLVTFEGCSDRTDAEALRGSSVEVSRTSLPALDEDEFYLADLEGCEAYAAGRRVGRVQRAASLPANAVLTIALDSGEEVLAPFTREAVPRLDIQQRRIEIDLDFLGIGNE